MDSHKRPTLVALPLIAISLLVAGMTQRASAADAHEVRSARTGVSAIDLLMDRVAQRAAERQREVESRRNDDTDEDTNESRETEREELDIPALWRRAALRAAERRKNRPTETAPARPAATEVVSAHAEDIAQQVFELVNAERIKAGVAPYTYNNTLERSAEEYSEHMRSTECFSHTECGSTLKERMHASGYYRGNGRSYSYGENIARGQDSAEEVVEDWMNSPSHRDAILSTKFKEIGIGRSGDYWTQHFGAVR